VTDPNFRNTTLLLQADNAANSAQNNTFLDSSPNSFPITRTGNTTQGTFTPFSQGWSNYFDGSGDNIVTPSNSAFDPSGSNITVDCFVYLTRYVGTNNIVFEVGASTVNDMQCNILNTGEVRFTVGGSTGSTISGFTLNTWHYITCVKSGTNFTVYLNGIAGTTVSLTVNSRTTMYIGSQSGGNNIDGYISNFRFVKGSANVPSGVPTAPLTNITNTSLLTCQSNRFVDNGTANSGSGFALTVNGNVSVKPFTPFAPQFQYTQSGIGGSGFFDGNGDYLTGNTTLSSSASMSTFTVEGWIYPTTLADVIWLIGDMSPTGTTNVLAVNIATSGAVQLYWYDGAGKTATSTSVMRANQWNWFAIVVNSNAISIFVNSTTSGQSGTTTLTGRTQDSNFAVGQYNGSTTPNAYISNLRWSNGIARTISSIPTAPYTSDANTRLLLNFTNAGIIDGTMDNVLETVGNAQISTSVVKYGSGSMFFDGTGDYLVPIGPNTSQFTFPGDFTIELWVYVTNIASYSFIFDGRASGATSGAWLVDLNGAVIGWGPGSSIVISSSSILANTWYHLAICRSGSSTRMFLNGTQTGLTYTDSGSYTVGTNRPIIGGSGNSPGSFNFPGYIDDLRITRGVARYISNFTPPQVALPRQ